MGTDKKTSKMSLKQITNAKIMCKNYDLTAEDLTEMYIRFNRMRQEQNFIRKIEGPNYLNAISAKPKLRIPDVSSYYLYSSAFTIFHWVKHSLGKWGKDWL